MIKKKLLLTFLVVIFLMMVSAITFVQSQRFARIVKAMVSDQIPADLGISGDFSNFEIGLFPPSIGISNPKLKVGAKNIINLPEGAEVHAEKLQLRFHALQLFSGSIRIHEVAVVKGNVQFELDIDRLKEISRKENQNKKKSGKRSKEDKLNWEDLINIQTESVVFEDSSIRFQVIQPQIDGSLRAQYLRVKQIKTQQGAGVELSLNLEDIQGSFPKNWEVPELISRLEASAILDRSGLELDEFKLQSVGLETQLKGKLSGDVLASQDLDLNSTVTIRGDIQTIFKRLKLKALQNNFQGQVEFIGELDGNLSRFLETVRADGELKGSKVRYQGWYTDQLYVKGSWLSGVQLRNRKVSSEQSKLKSQTAQGYATSFVGPPWRDFQNELLSRSADAVHALGQILISRLEIESAQRKRMGAYQAGHGGKVEIGQFSIPLGQFSELSVPVELKNAHLHWLVGNALEDVYPLDFRVSGKADLQFSFDPKFNLLRVAPQLDIKIQDFVLDNQKMGKVVSQHKLLNVPQLALKGSVEIKNGVLVPSDNVFLTLPNSELKVEGKIGGPSGYDLKVNGPLDLKDFSTLSEIPIRGKGRLEAHIHGPAKGLFLEFNPQLKDAEYLGLRLGDLQGKIIYEDFSEILRFNQVVAQQGRSQYLGNGHLNLDKNQADLDFSFTKGDISDVIEIFSEKIEHLQWFPHSLTGEFTGKVAIRGGLQTNELIVKTSLSGKDWEYLGERMPQLILSGGFDRGVYSIQQFKGQKYQGEIQGDVSYDENTEETRWNIRASQLALNDFDHIARLDVPVRGNLSLSSSGYQSKSGTQSETQLIFRDTFVRGQPLPNSSLELLSDKNFLKVNGNAFGGQGKINLNYAWKLGDKSNLKIESKRLDFSPVILMLNPNLMQDRELSGLISGTLNLDFITGQAELASGRLSLDDYQLKRRGHQLSLENPHELEIRDGNFLIKDLVFKGDQSRISAEILGQRGKISGRFSGYLDLSVLEYVAAEVQRSSGKLELDMQPGGTLKLPTLSGRMNVSDGNIKLASFEQFFDSIKAQFRLDRSVLTVESFQALLAGSPVNLGGNIEFYTDRFPRLGLNANLRNNRIAVYPFQFVDVSGQLQASGDAPPYEVTGNIRISSAVSREKMLAASGPQSRNSSPYSPSATQSSNSETPLFRLNIQASAERNILIKNDLFDAELAAQIRLINTIDSPLVLGEARLIQGQLRFKDQSFQISTARINFDNPARLDPEFSLSAHTQVKKTKINLFASGRLEKWKLDLSSDPAKPEAEIIQMLALGLTPEDMKRLQGDSGGLLQQGEAMMLLLQSLDFNRNVKEKTGFEIELQESYDTQSPNRIFDNPVSQEAQSAPKLVIKRKIGEKVGISLGTTVGVGNVSEREVNAEFEVGPGVSVNGVWNDFEGGLETNSSNQESFGVDLKFQKRFK